MADECQGGPAFILSPSSLLRLHDDDNLMVLRLSSSHLHPLFFDRKVRNA